MHQTLRVESAHRDDWIDITPRVAACVRQRGGDGVVTLFVPHTTAGITVQENADPPLKGDINGALERLFPRQGPYGHCEDNAASHMKAMLAGASLSIPFQGGALLLGTWQAIYVCEFDGPRSREVRVFIPD
jgi:secondary thiamine-phosphate synthase enzyme